MLGPLAVSQNESPCALHGSHRPMTWSNERHHIFPLYLQRKAWGEERDDERFVTCATGHNNVHLCVEDLIAGRAFRYKYSRSEVRLAREGVRRYEAAVAEAAKE